MVAIGFVYILNQLEVSSNGLYALRDLGLDL